MTQLQLQELIQVHHPDMTETEIRLRLNNALKEFCRKTRILKGAFQFDTALDADAADGSYLRYYGLDNKIIEVESVDYNSNDIQRLSGRPQKRDLT
tara:strand:+ start:481 stop:768 length:288 start_codon:yes stop_codon:yes gene_type:complete